MVDTSQISSRVLVRILPSEDEDDDMETLSLVQHTHSGFLTDVSHLKTYTVEQVSDATRGGGFIVLATKFVRGIVAQKDLIKQIFQTSQTTIDVLSKQGHVKAIEMTIDGNSIRIEDASDTQVDRLITLFEAQHSEKVQQITCSSLVEVIGRVSKIEQTGLSKRTITEKKGQ